MQCELLRSQCPKVRNVVLEGVGDVKVAWKSNMDSVATSVAASRCKPSRVGNLVLIAPSTVTEFTPVQLASPEVCGPISPPITTRFCTVTDDGRSHGS